MPPHLLRIARRRRDHQFCALRRIEPRLLEQRRHPNPGCPMHRRRRREYSAALTEFRHFTPQGKIATATANTSQPPSRYSLSLCRLQRLVIARRVLLWIVLRDHPRSFEFAPHAHRLAVTIAADRFRRE